MACDLIQDKIADVDEVLRERLPGPGSAPRPLPSEHRGPAAT